MNPSRLRVPSPRQQVEITTGAVAQGPYCLISEGAAGHSRCLGLVLAAPAAVEAVAGHTALVDDVPDSIIIARPVLKHCARAVEQRAVPLLPSVLPRHGDGR